ncbi:quinolinate synthase NadA [Chloroflexota bacterium]
MDNNNAALIEKIESLKKSRNAVFLAHNFQLGEVQDIAGFVGDSLEVIQEAAATDADVIVICGVHFLAETAAIIRPDKIVLLPDISAGCPLVDMVTAARLREKKKENPGAMVVCYVNSSAAVKAESDICYTAANAIRIVEKLPPGEEILFIPDQYLGDFVATQTERDLVLWPGFCSTHIKIRPEDISRLKAEHPQAKVVVHMECIPPVKALADAVSGSGGILRFACETDAKEIIVGTETGILHRLRKENPDKTFIAASERAICPKMKLVTLEKILWSLENMGPQVKVGERNRLKAKKAVDKMLDG